LITTTIILFFPFHIFPQNQQTKGTASRLVFSQPQGFYPEGFDLSINNIPEDAILRYTTDGSLPGLNSPGYSGPIPVTNRYSAPNRISMIPTNPLDTPYTWYVWQPPSANVCKANIIRFELFYDDRPDGETTTLTYFVDTLITQRYNNFAVLSLVTDSINLFGYDSGIYVPGLHYDLGPGWSWWGGDNANYLMRGDDWERPANLTFFEGDGSFAFQQDVGIRIHGGGTRVLPQKSLRIYARSEYGQSKINYQFFPEKDVDHFKRIILHNNGQDFITGSMNDVITSALVRHLDLDFQSYRPAILFINGEYWGIQGIRDRLDEYYLQYSHGVDPDNVDILEGNGIPENGDSLNFRAMIHFIEQNDLRDDVNYNYIKSQIDIPAYIEYVICKQYLAVDDWPGNNITCWRERKEGGKWRWFFYDNNYAMFNCNANSILSSIEAGGTVYPNPDWSTLILRNLMRNYSFKQQYLDRFEYHLQNTFTPERLIHFTDSINDLITPVLAEHIQRWQYPQSESVREGYINQIKSFAVARPEQIRQQLSVLVDVPELSDTDKDIRVYYSSGLIYLNLPSDKAGSYRIIDIEGRNLLAGKLNGRNQITLPSPIKAGIVIVQITLEDKTTSEKLVIY